MFEKWYTADINKTTSLKYHNNTSNINSWYINIQNFSKTLTPFKNGFLKSISNSMTSTIYHTNINQSIELLKLIIG